MKTLRERYHNDAAFKTLVDMMVAHIQQANYTPSEMREAAILASIIYEEHNFHKIRFVEKKTEIDLRQVEYHLQKIIKRMEE